MKKSGIVYSKILVLVLIGALLGSCSGGGGGGSSSGMDPSSDQPAAPDLSGVAESLTIDQRNAAVDEVNQNWATINTGSDAGDNQLLVDYLRSRADFADAGIAPDGTVWARFVDGYPVIFLTTSSTSTAPGKALSVSEGPASAPKEAAMPAGDKAVLLDVDTLAAGSLATIEPALINKGYSTSKPAGKVPDFMAIKNTSVLFVSSHGGTNVTKKGTTSYVVMTNEQIVASNPNDPYLVSLGALFRAGELVYTGVRVRNTNNQQISVGGKFWAITDLFVTNNWAFTNNSLVVLDTCELFFDRKLTKAADKAPYEKFRSALNGAGATVILGWDGQVSPGFASNVMRLFFDRVLGYNTYQPEAPKQRPFPFKEVHDWLVMTGRAQETNGGGLTIQFPAASRGQLAPTIYDANVLTPAPGSQYAGKRVLEISGDFGPDAGKVTVNNTTLALLEPWNDTLLYAEMPSSLTAPGSYGDLIVEVRNHKSNAVPITKWTGQVSQSQTGTDLGVGSKLDISCPMEGIADVHLSRGNPAETPELSTGLGVVLAGPCTYTLSGQWFEGNIRYDLSGSGSASPMTSNPLLVGGSLLYQASGTTLPLDFQGGVVPTVSAAGTLARTDLDTGLTTVSTVYAGWAFATGNVTLGSGYVFSEIRPCFGPIQCTETWSLQPVAGTTPGTNTES